MNKPRVLVGRYLSEVLAVVIFIAGGFLCVQALVQTLPVYVGIIGLIIIAAGLFYFCIRYTLQKALLKYYKDSYEIEHATIEQEIRTSMRYHRYQEAVLSRYESACRDLGLTNEQKDYLLMLLMEEKNKVDNELAQQGGGYI